MSENGRREEAWEGQHKVSAPILVVAAHPHNRKNRGRTKVALVVPDPLDDVLAQEGRDLERAVDVLVDDLGRQVALGCEVWWREDGLALERRHRGRGRRDEAVEEDPGLLVCG